MVSTKGAYGKHHQLARKTYAGTVRSLKRWQRPIKTIAGEYTDALFEPEDPSGLQLRQHVHPKNMSYGTEGPILT